MSETRSTCPYCGVGCGVVIEHDGQQITGVRGDPEHPANFGRLCTKGTNLHLAASPVVLQHQRLREPFKRATRGAARYWPLHRPASLQQGRRTAACGARLPSRASAPLEKVDVISVEAFVIVSR